MQYRELGRTGWQVSTVSFGAWAIGGTWGSVDDRESLDALRRAVDLGVNFFDTADVYGGGHSERLLGTLKRERPDLRVVFVGPCIAKKGEADSERLSRRAVELHEERFLARAGFRIAMRGLLALIAVEVARLAAGRVRAGADAIALEPTGATVVTHRDIAKVRVVHILDVRQ